MENGMKFAVIQYQTGSLPVTYFTTDKGQTAEPGETIIPGLTLSEATNIVRSNLRLTVCAHAARMNQDQDIGLDTHNSSDRTGWVSPNDILGNLDI